MRLRSIVAVDPAGAGFERAIGSPADALLFAVADGSQAIDELRHRVAEGLLRTRGVRKRGLVVLNHPRTRLLRDDVDALPLWSIDAVLLPHAVDPQDVRDVAVALREFELKRNREPGTVAVYPVIDSARGLLRASEIAAAAPRVAGLVFDADAYAADVLGREEPRGERLAYARGLVVAAARAHEGQPLVRSGDLELPFLAHYGFAGAILSQANAADTANTAFTPTAATLEHARAQVAAYETAREAGQWVARLGGEVIDAHTVRVARRLLEDAQ